MSVQILLLYALALSAVSLAAGFAWGRFHERKQWNDLLETGKIPVTDAVRHSYRRRTNARPPF